MNDLEDVIAPDENLDTKNGYLYKAQRDIMGDKSKICFGSRGKWKKLMDLTDNTPRSMEAQMDKIIIMMKEQGVTNESEQPSKRSQGNRKLRRKRERFIQKLIRKGSKIRPEQDKNGIVAD